MTGLQGAIDGTRGHPEHEGHPCFGQWCCGCVVHPIGKPWGWAVWAWEAHYEEAHRGE